MVPTGLQLRGIYHPQLLQMWLATAPAFFVMPVLGVLQKNQLQSTAESR
jgi:hypothetical protein